MRRFAKFMGMMLFAVSVQAAQAPSARAAVVTGSWDVTTVWAYDGLAGFYTPAAITGCLYDLLFIDTTTQSGNALWSLLLTAHTARHKITAIHWSVAGNGWCWVDRLDMAWPSP